MPRQSRLDALGAMHHIIVRGIECHKFFSDDDDRYKFIERLAGIINKTDTGRYRRWKW